MSDPIDPLQRWQLDLEAKLNAEAYYIDIPVTVVRPRKNLTAVAIQTKIDQGLSGLIKKNGKAGISVQILMPLCDVPHADPSGPSMTAFCTVRVQEMPEVNMGASGTMKPVEEVALQTMNVLHRFIPGNGFSQQGFHKEAYTPSLEFAPKLTVDLKLESRFAIAGPGRVQTPVIAGTAGGVQISCNTPGAEVYYTLDYSFPAPPSASPTAIYYGRVVETESGLIITTEAGADIVVPVPFTVEPGAFIRAAAYLPESKQGSDVAMHQF